MEFDKNRLMNNINTLIKERGLKIGSVETEVGISTGYLSRMSKAENDTMPGIDLICKLAQILEVNVDTLVNGDFGRSNDNLLFMIKFINSLIADTDMHVFEWESFKKYEELAEKYGFMSMPMQTKTMRVNLQEHTSFAEYHSMFDDKTGMKMTGPNYCAFVPAIGPVLLFKLERAKADNVSSSEYELYAIGDSGLSGERFTLLCTTLENDGAVRPGLLDLYNCIEKHDKDIKVSEDTKNLINRYMFQRSSEGLPFI